MSLFLIVRCAFCISGVSQGGFLMELEIYVIGHALLNALVVCSFSFLHAESRSFVVDSCVSSTLRLFLRCSWNKFQSVFFVSRTCLGVDLLLDVMSNMI